MEIKLEGIGRRFNRDWVFRNIDFIFSTQQSYAILGPNGSGKSTFMQLISGQLIPSEGAINYKKEAIEVDISEVYQNIALAAPYLELIEEYTLQETIDFHFQFKKPINQSSSKNILEMLGMEKVASREIRYFSSGMKQRVKLALAIFSDVPVLMLDEPTANLDTEGIDWYLQLMANFSGDRMVLVASNQAHEYSFCTHKININDYK